MARRVPGARPGSAPAPPPKFALRGPGTFAFTRGEVEGTGPGRGGAPSGLWANPRRTWAGRLCPRPPGGVAWGDRGRSTRVREGAAPPRSHPPWGAPGSLTCRSPQPPNARVRRGHALPPRRGLGVPSGYRCLFQVAPDLPQRAQNSQSQHTLPPFISLHPATALASDHFQIFCLLCPCTRRARVPRSFPCFTSLRTTASQGLPFGFPRRDRRGA